MTKRNKKDIRRARHAKRLSKIIANARDRAHRFRPTDCTVLRGPNVYGVAHEEHAVLCRAVYMGFTLPARTNAGGFARWVHACTSVDCVPVAMQAYLRGRRSDQMHAELRENRSRIKHGDIR